MTLVEIVLALGFALLTLLIRRPHPHGAIMAVTGLLYLPARFVLDLLRIRDATYAGLTPAQWMCLPALAFVALFAYRAWVQPRAEASVG